MARIEGVYQRYLKTIPPNKIKTLTPQESYEIEMKISEAFCKKLINIVKNLKYRFCLLLKMLFFQFLNDKNIFHA